MKTCYFKLPTTHDIKYDYSEQVSSEWQASDPSRPSYNLAYCEVSHEIKAQLFEFIPVEHHKHFEPSVMIVKSDVPCHVDDIYRCNINFYVDTGNSITNFFEADLTGNIVHYGEMGIGFFDELKFIDSFKPANGDIYVIDTTVPHTVSKQDVDTRIVYTVHSRLTFTEVCEILGIPVDPTTL